jgi:hypothetical protein
VRLARAAPCYRARVTDRTGTTRTAVALWLAALVLMLAAATWQRLSGPTQPRRGRAEVAGQDVRWRLARSATSGEPFLVSVPAAPPATGRVRYRRFPTSQPFAEIEMRREGASLAALLPSQPPAGKLEYSLTLLAAGREVRIPEGEPVVMRFKADVPALVLIPHVTAMFFSMLIGIRAALAAVLGRPEAKRYAWVTLVGITIGGMILGPIVQKYAFGAFWTGWPFGGDLTDNKTAAMWLAWIAVVVVLARRREPTDRVARVVVAVAAAVMIAVYVVPHSLRGSQLDDTKAQDGAAASEAVTTGR